MVNLFAKLLSNRRGNVAMMTALMSVPVLALVGGGVDLARVTSARLQLNSALESGVLAAASLTNTRDPETVIEEYVLANMAGTRLSENLNVRVLETTNNLNKRVMVVEATSDVPTYFLKLVDIDKMDIVASSTATQSSTNVEIALVLDISSSMSGGRIANLKDAAPKFIDQMLEDDTIDTTSINLIPFGGTVNIGSSLFGDFSKTDLDPSDDTDGVITNPSKAQYNIGNTLIDDGFRFDSSHLDPSDDGYRAGPDSYCIEYHKDDFDTELIPNGSRSQVPHFWKWTNFNPWCPDRKSGIILNTNNATVLKDRIAEMTLSDGTGMDLGTLWAVKTLSPEWRGKLGGDFSDRPLDNDETTLKVAVLMTDGGITAQFRPENWTYFSTHEEPWPHSKNNGKIKNEDKSRSNANKRRDRNQQTILAKGNVNDDLTNNTAVGQFNHLCDILKANGVTVYTIGFQIKDGSSQDQYLEKCASHPSKYYLVESLDIQAAFDSIAASVSSLRIVG